MKWKKLKHHTLTNVLNIVHVDAELKLLLTFHHQVDGVGEKILYSSANGLKAYKVKAMGEKKFASAEIWLLKFFFQFAVV